MNGSHHHAHAADPEDALDAVLAGKEGSRMRSVENGHRGGRDGEGGT